MLSITLLELFFSNSAGQDEISCQFQASFCATAYLQRSDQIHRNTNTVSRPYPY